MSRRKSSRNKKSSRANRARSEGARRGRRSARQHDGRARQGKGRRRTLLRGAARLVLLAAVWCLIGASLLVAYYAYDLPSLDRIESATRRPTIVMLDRSGARIAVYGNLRGSHLSLDEMPRHMRDAVIAIEDRSFYAHRGVDVLGMLRAATVNILEGSIRQGGSTITQQLAKNVFLTHQRSVRRKIQEILLAIWIEQRYAKDEILSLYLNRVYLGKGTYGVDAAARLYFGVPAREINLYQAALLAGLLKAPSRLNPLNDQRAARGRARLVLEAMVDAGFITRPELRAALDDKGIVLQPRRNLMRRYFTDWALEQVSEHIGFVDEDLVVVTTLSASQQQLAEDRVRSLLPRDQTALQVALVAMRPDGAVRAMIGGRDYGSSQFNRAVLARRQPGSAFKPFVFLAAMEAGIEPGDHFTDAPIGVGDWRPRNYRNRYFGEVTLREAMTRSLNSVAVRVSERVGHASIIESARRLGIDAPLRPHPSIALGASEVTLLELSGAYAVFANEGHAVEPYGILEIRTSEGRVLYRRPEGRARRVVDRRQVEQMNDVLRAVIVWGTGAQADIGRPAAGKTGTTQQSRDGWFVGYTPQLATGVWIGRDDDRPVQGLTGGGLPARLWSGFMRDAHAGQPVRGLPGVAN